MAWPIAELEATAAICSVAPAAATTETMVHPGLPIAWAAVAMLMMIGLSLPVLRGSPGNASRSDGDHMLSLTALPMIGPALHEALRRPWLLLTLRILTAALFLLLIAAGLFGSPIPERNLATVLTWTFWWTGIVIAVLLLGSAWCAICPWDALAAWLVRRRLWRRGAPHTSLNLRYPSWLRNQWPALSMLAGLTWLELGVGVTTSPYATALLGLAMVVMATTSMALFERKGFCQYVCPIGRTLGAYSTTVPVAVRPIDPLVCADCKTLECYHGTDQIEPCPTHLVIGRTDVNQFCTSCGACVQSCPSHNVSWGVRPVANEAMHHTRGHWDGAWFMVGLVALTSFHGLTMLPEWEQWMRHSARWIGDSGQLLWTFSLGMALSLVLIAGTFVVTIRLTQRLGPRQADFKPLFNNLALAVLPLAFAYHIAHNLSHMLRESHGTWAVFVNPFGRGTLPLSTTERHALMTLPIPEQLLFTLQAGLIVLGLGLAVRILGARARKIGLDRGVSRVPTTTFLLGVSGMNLWLLTQPMIMRM